MSKVNIPKKFKAQMERAPGEEAFVGFGIGHLEFVIFCVP